MTPGLPSIQALLVEDNPGDADLVIEGAASEPHRPIHFEVQDSLAGAMEEISKNPPDIVLLDLGLPDSAGIPTFERFKQAFPDMPVIVLTGHDDVTLAIRCIELGAQDFLPKGRVEHFIAGTIHNAVARARTQRALAETRKNLHRMIADNPDPILVLDQDSNVLFANEAASNLFGEKVKVGQTISTSILKKDLRELEMERDDGSSVTVEVRIGDTSWYGHPAQILTLRDITERKQTEQDRERLLTAIEQTEDTVIVTDPHGNIQYVNPAFESSTGYTREDALGQHVKLMSDDKMDLNFFSKLQESLENEKVWSGRIDQKRKNGIPYTVEATISPVTDPEGKIINFVAVNRDITEQLRIQEEKSGLEEQLRQSQRMESIGRLAAGVAHDFNNMLSVILGYAQIILYRMQDEDSPLAQEVGQIEDAARRSAVLVRQLLAFSRLQTLQPIVWDLNEIIRGIEPMLRRLIGEDIELRMEIPQNEYRVMVDSGQMEQVIMNLVVNSRDAMLAGGTLLIETASIELDETYAYWQPDITPGAYIVMALTDTGSGIPKEVIDNIFEPFFTTKESGKGTGLGLSTVYGIIKQSGGNIHVYSEQGQGTTFRIYFPRTDAEVVPIQETHPQPSMEKRHAHILVVEDEKIIRNLLANLLPQLGHQVTVAEDGEKALAFIEKNNLRPDILITDVIMPNMSGKELVDKARQIIPDLKFLYMSGYTDNAIAAHGILEPGTPFMQKPFTLADLTLKIEALFSGELEN